VDRAPPGFHRYVGTVRNGEWQIERTFPPIDRETLGRMLALAREAETREGFTFPSREEGEEVLRRAGERDFLLRDKLPRLAGLTLQFPKRHLDLTPLLAVWVYQVRFGAIWPAIGRGEDLTTWDAAMDRIAAAGAAWATGERVYEGNFANYTRGDIFSIEEMDRHEVERVDREMQALGLEHLGDLNTTQTFAAVFRAYGGADSGTYGCLVKAVAAGDFAGRFHTAFEDGWLLTTAAEGPRRLHRDAQHRMLSQGGPMDLPTRFATHQAAVQAHAAAHHGAKLAVPTLAGFAAALDEYLLRLHR
jgi:hypothetical protein